MIAILSDGHVLLEGAPGLAKTTAIKSLAAGIAAKFHRIQFTPDLLPADITGTDIYRVQDGNFSFQQGPIFNNLVLADEINRAPAKVQSALLEAMAERQVTVGGTTYALPQLFMVLATQNPIEQQGTYPLPEAQLDRFLLYLTIDYPDAKTEKQILQLNRRQAQTSNTTSHPQINAVASIQDIINARRQLWDIHLSPELETYITQLTLATRNPASISEKLAQWQRLGASPRATFALERCARANAWLNNREYVTPEDIHFIAHDVLRHRILLSFSAEAAGITTDNFIDELLACVAIP